MEVLIVFWLICGGVAAMIASSKGGSGVAGFFAGALLGPLGIVAAVFMGSEEGRTEKMLAGGGKKKCSRCAELTPADRRALLQIARSMSGNVGSSESVHARQNAYVRDID